MGLASMQIDGLSVSRRSATRALCAGEVFMGETARGGRASWRRWDLQVISISVIWWGRERASPVGRAVYAGAGPESGSTMVGNSVGIGFGCLV